MIFYSRTTPMVIAAAAAAGCAFLSIEVDAFQPLLSQTSTAALSRARSRETPFATKKPLTIMYRIRCENKYYQLEELEDADNCTTELFLKEDGTVDIGETDGPLFTKAVGRWEIKENSFAMTMTKTLTMTMTIALDVYVMRSTVLEWGTPHFPFPPLPPHPPLQPRPRLQPQAPPA